MTIDKSRPSSPSRQVESVNLITKDTQLQGDIRLGRNVILHPYVRIIQEHNAGYICIGDDTIIEERVIIHNKSPDPMIIGENCLLKSACKFYGSSLGADSILSPRGIFTYSSANIYENVKIGKCCHIGPGTFVSKNAVIQDGTIIYDTITRMRTLEETQDGEESHRKLQQKHLAYLKDILPKYHHMKDEK